MSPSGRHLGIYKTLLTVYFNNDEEFNQDNEERVTTQQNPEDIYN